MAERDIEIVAVDADPRNRADSGRRFRIRLHAPHPFGALHEDIGWWKSEKRAIAEAAALRKMLREWGFMA